MDLRLSDHETHAILTHLTSVLLGLQILRERTPLSPRQRELAEHALRSGQALRTLLVEQIARQVAEPLTDPRGDSPEPTRWSAAERRPNPTNGSRRR